ncbi:hypothetical protein [Sporosarcina limicola]|uniref:Uncharacterized lipoprotein YehR (DUF1307 family) n=1 Tax=Sporosarcina limicola TaxID=34101 RepID=A0A927R8I0_9BACL|nr:hypothetical protein [Sporosarcina limicola]MBE1557024.1 uncharacterized lipoprotein YehR (DUF1307 family) [Sporosarcina limicola]
MKKMNVIIAMLLAVMLSGCAEQMNSQNQSRDNLDEDEISASYGKQVVLYLEKYNEQVEEIFTLLKLFDKNPDLKDNLSFLIEEKQRWYEIRDSQEEGRLFPISKKDEELNDVIEMLRIDIIKVESDILKFLWGDVDSSVIIKKLNEMEQYKKKIKDLIDN